jgi:hypothetical protein
MYIAIDPIVSIFLEQPKWFGHSSCGTYLEKASVAVHHLIQQAPADLTHFSSAHHVFAGMEPIHFQQEQVWRALVSSKAETGHSPFRFFHCLSASLTCPRRRHHCRPRTPSSTLYLGRRTAQGCCAGCPEYCAQSSGSGVPMARPRPPLDR